MSSRLSARYRPCPSGTSTQRFFGGLARSLKSFISRTRKFWSCAFAVRSLAEGHFHRSLGQRPRKRVPRECFGRRPYSRDTASQGEYGRWPMMRLVQRIPGALPQATVMRGLRPKCTDAKLRNFKTRKRGWLTRGVVDDVELRGHGVAEVDT
jgi:hypothetical protein